MSIPRRHHYLPQFYLAGFTPSGRKDDLLHVLDMRTGRCWKSKPIGVASQLDYYRLDQDAFDPFAFEKGLSRFEGQAAATLKEVLAQRAIPDFEHRLTLINFIASTAIRVPSQRNMLAEAKKQVATMALQLAVSSPERWEALTSRMKAAGQLVGDVSYEEVRDFAMDESRYTIELSQEALIETTFKALDSIIPLLLDRKWSIALAGDGAGDFICCDDPVARHWSISQHPPIVPGFSLRHSFIVMPLDRRTALLGEWEGEEEVFTIGRQGVAELNSLIMHSASRFLFLPSQDIYWLTQDGRIAGEEELMAWYKAHPTGEESGR